nr:helix-turn-helix transcriptional regulator [Amycolatopsis nigrescens]
MGTRESCARARQLGNELRRVREKSGMTGHALALAIGWPASKISRMESGKRLSSEVEVAIYLSKCGAPREVLNRLLALARETDDGFRLQSHHDHLPDTLVSLVGIETTADALITYEPGLIPGILQTEGYVRELLLWGRRGLKTEGYEVRVDARLARQQILKRRWPPRVDVYIHENALRGVVGGMRVMHDQVMHLAMLCAQPRIGLRVIESSVPGGIFGSGFTVTRWAEYRPVAYVEGHAASMFLEEPEELRVYRDLIGELGVHALNERDSWEWLVGLASEYDRPDPQPARP